MFGFDKVAEIEAEIPEYNYHPSAYKIFADHTLPMQVPG
jgi:hypothetical protein